MSAMRAGSVVGGAGAGAGGVDVDGVGGIGGSGGDADCWAAMADLIFASMVSLASLSLLISDLSDSSSCWCLVLVSVILSMITTLLSRLRLSCSVRSSMVLMRSAVFEVEAGSSLVIE